VIFSKAWTRESSAAMMSGMSEDNSAKDCKSELELFVRHFKGKVIIELRLSKP
jgi:hypothetical protein